jgi:demethylmenaquinone methyltransferase/2-methoxy-6-polyprenyl-1,4-benzoquinol methylase
MPEPTPSVSPAQAPHALLTQYYSDERQKRAFIREIFDSTAGDYDRVESTMALGTGSWYRRSALVRAGLKPGMKTLDVAIGTGLVAREAMKLAGDQRLVFGVDPSQGMLAQAVRQLDVRAVRATAERLPLADDNFDFLTMGYALRHLADLASAFGEFHRVLRPGGVACILEITRPAGKIRMALLRGYMRGLVPLISRITTRTRQSPMLWQYYWDTIEACVPPEQVMQAMRDAGFVDVKRYVELGIFSEYTGRKGA